jgi:hypothetical protein
METVETVSHREYVSTGLKPGVNEKEFLRDASFMSSFAPWCFAPSAKRPYRRETSVGLS